METLLTFIMGLFGITRKAEFTGNNNDQPTNGTTNATEVVMETNKVTATEPESIPTTASDSIRRARPEWLLALLNVGEAPPKVIRRPDGSLKKVYVESIRHGRPHSFKVKKIEGGDIFIQRSGHPRAHITCRPLSIFE